MRPAGGYRPTSDLDRNNPPQGGSGTIPVPAPRVLHLSLIRASATHITREELLEGRRHLVAPVVMLVEGVHHGSKGKALYTAQELSTYPDSWNGVPVTIQHPSDSDGMPMSANAPRVIEEQAVGRLFDVSYDSAQKKLRGEIWIDAEKTGRLSPELVEALASGKEIEVSTGHWSEDTLAPGTWNGEDYDAIVRHIRPDHLALLPGAVGACSWDDGCGVRRNETPCTCQPAKGDAPAGKGKMIKELIQKLSGVLGFKADELSHDDLRSKLAAKLADSMPNNSHFVRDVYDDNFVFEMSSLLNPYGSYELYRVGYTIDANDEVEMVGEPEKVREERSYVPLENSEESEMTKDETIGNLIKDPKNKFDETDRGWLRALPPERLAKFAVNEPPPPPEPEKPEDDEEPKGEAKKVEAAPVGDPAAPATPPVSAAPAPPAPEPKPQTVEDYVAAAPPEMREVLNSALERQRQEKEAVVKQLLANKRCSFTEKQLKDKDFGELLVLARLADTEVDYSGRAGAPSALHEDDDAVPPMPKVFENV